MTYETLYNIAVPIITAIFGLIPFIGFYDGLGLPEDKDK